MSSWALRLGVACVAATMSSGAVIGWRRLRGEIPVKMPKILAPDWSEPARVALRSSGPVSVALIL